jgi:hypothetical protein
MTFTFRWFAAPEPIVVNLQRPFSPRRTWSTALACCLAAQACLFASSAERASFTTEVDGVTIRCDGRLFTRYLLRSGRRPVLWPVMGPTQQPMTRAFPLGEGPADEPRDHPHHRSLWIGYEGINDVDFWHQPQPGATRPYPAGEQVHRKFSTLRVDGDTVLLAADVDWLDPDGQRVLREERTLRFGGDPDRRWIDWQSKLFAGNGPVRIGDSKEGLISLRVAAALAIDAKQGGRVVNSRGQTNADLWGQHAEWVDYHGPVAGQTVGIALLAHPESFHSPPRWHTRTYGLMGANPFAEIALSSENPSLAVPDRPLIHTIPAGDSLHLRYRFIFHLGNEKEANIAEAYEKYAAE